MCFVHVHLVYRVSLFLSTADYSIRSGSSEPAVLVKFNLCRTMVAQPQYFGVVDSGGPVSLGDQEVIDNLRKRTILSFLPSHLISSKESQSYLVVLHRIDSRDSNIYTLFLFGIPATADEGAQFNITGGISCPGSKSGT